MTFARPWRLVVLFVLIVAFPAVWPSTAQPTAQPPSQPASSASAAPAAQANSQQAYTLPPDKLAKAIALSRIRNILDIVGSLWAVAVLWLLLATRFAAGLASWAERLLPRRWMQGLLFFAAFIVITTLAGLPLEVYGEHVSRIYGISVQGWASFAGDEAKSLGLAVLFGSPILLLFNWIVRRWPRRYWLGIWLATLPLLVLVTFVEPLVEPLFNKFEPLEKTNPALVAQLEKVVVRTGTNIPPSRMFLMKASAKTNGLNAYVSGIGATKRIVVWDTTAGRIPDDEILFVFAHESGHYVLHHIPKMIAGSAVGLFFVYWACAGFAAWLAKRFGKRWIGRKPEDFVQPEPPLATRAGFLVLLFAISIAGFLLEPVQNTVSRYFEHQADVYGQEAIHGIVPDPQQTAVRAFNALGQAWLEDPHPNPFIEFWLFSHPSVEQRANFALHYNPWANGGHGKYFAH
jgi:Zn-dependent protease with chaperone function